ncbi:MAG: trigger factor, partial [Propionibacteriaceae bacterium]|jgi:trigger factor|nr:trigger factor [Propionibacteriaceae bacterium]
LVTDEVAARTSQVAEQLKAAGMTMEDYLARMGNPEIASAEQFAQSIRQAVERGVRAEILLSRVSDEVEIKVGQEDLTNLIFQKAQENGTTPEREIQHMQEHNHLPEWMGQIRQSKALDAIVAQASVVDTKGQKVDVMAVLTPSAPQVDIDEAVAEAAAIDVDETA